MGGRGLGGPGSGGPGSGGPGVGCRRFDSRVVTTGPELSGGPSNLAASINRPRLGDPAAMTQMLLFDPPAATPPAATITGDVSAVAPIVPDSAAASVVPVVAGRSAAAGEPIAHREGLNHMGDLARLVILRYELAAKRRASAARRRAAK